MRVCLIGHFGDSLDEGVRNVARNVGIKLAHKAVKVREVDISRLLGWKAIRAFDPDILHFILTPTLLGFVSAKMLSFQRPQAKMVLSAIHPAVPRSRFLKPFRPDLVLVQSHESESLFQSIGCRTHFFANGVDLSKFKPTTEANKRRLKDEFGLPHDHIVLHLGPIKKARNLGIFKRIQEQEDTQVLIVGREKEVADKPLLNDLLKAGCIVWQKHFSHVEEVYQASDCYVFPTTQKNACVETPLSVLEAMASNLPIITTRFGALPGLFSAGSGLFFVEEAESIPHVVDDVRNTNLKVETREMVLPYSWDNLTENLVEIYEGLLQ